MTSPPQAPRLPMPPEQRRTLARAGEALAAKYLVAQGMQLLHENWRCPLGELDLVLLDDGVLVVCEVKTRRSEAFGHPLEAITHAKLARLRQLAAVCAREVGRERGRGLTGLRIDAVGIVWPTSGAPVLRHVAAVGS